MALSVGIGFDPSLLQVQHDWEASSMLLEPYGNPAAKSNQHSYEAGLGEGITTCSKSSWSIALLTVDFRNPQHWQRTWICKSSHCGNLKREFTMIEEKMQDQSETMVFYRALLNI